MRKNDHEVEYLTFSEIKDEYPKEAADWSWTAKMFNYYSQGGLIERRFNYSIKRYEYDRKSLILIMQLVNKRLDDRRMNP